MPTRSAARTAAPTSEAARAAGPAKRAKRGAAADGRAARTAATGPARAGTRLPAVRLSALTIDDALAAVGDPPPGGVAVAVPFARGADGPALGAGAAEVGSALGLDLAGHLAAEEAKGEPGEVVPLPVAGHPSVRRVLLVGVGDGDEPALRKAAAVLARRGREFGTVITTLGAGRRAEELRAAVESLLLACYTFSLRSEPKPPKLTTVELLVDRPERVRSAVDRAAATARGVVLARDLMNMPSLEKTPAWLADAAADVAARTGLEVRIRDERALAAEGFGGILGVGMGSAHPPRLIELRYDPPGARRHVVLVGKGITFDSGGLSLKTTDGMILMKTDMGGGGTVVGAMSALAELDVKVRVTGLVPAAENMPSGSALRPGDVIRHYDGRTVEVLNTDAEGRLVLADAIGYAVRELDPDVVIDLATLTGAATLALGRRYGALFSPDDELASALVEAAESGGELLWRMPMVEEYRPALDSTIADLRNIADPKAHFSGGAVTAALFLREFTGGRRWAHLDIAGPARAEKDDDDISKGGTGYGVRTLLRYLEALGGPARRGRRA